MSTKDSLLTTLTFECSYGDIKTAEAPKLQIKEPGVYLHFLRYGLFDKAVAQENRHYVDNETKLNHDPANDRNENPLFLHIKEFELEQRLVKIDNTYVDKPKYNMQYEYAEIKTITLDEVIVKGKKHTIEGLPDLDNFYHTKTSLNQGYVYLINADDPNDYYELFVNADGQLQHINWEYEKNLGEDGNVLDVRIPDANNMVQAKRIDPPGKRLWVAYSPSQWSRGYHQMLMDNKELRNKRMKLIRCEPLKKGEQRTAEGNHELVPVPFTEAYAVYNDKNDYRAGVLHQTLQDIAIEEKQEEENGDNEEYQDLFFVLDDPIGMAQDVADVLNKAHDRHRATLESMQTGENEAVIFDRLQTRPDAISNFITTPYGQQANALFTKALTLYGFIYHTNDEIKDKFEDDLDFDKINTILGFKYRAKQRERIAAIRNDYLQLIKSDYYKTAFVDGLRGSNQDTFENRCIIASQLSLLTEHPQHKDRFIDPADDYKGNEDNDFDDFISSSVNSNDEHFQLFTKEINLDKLTQSTLALQTGFKLSRRVVKSLKDVTTAYTRHAYLVEDSEILSKTIKAFKDSRGWNIKINTSALDKVLAESNKGLFPLLFEKEGILFGNKGKILKIRTSRNVAQQAAQTKTLTIQTQGLGSNTSKLLKGILDSPHFRKWMAGMELVNTLIKVKSIYDKKSAKNIAGLSGSGASLTSATLAYQEASLKVAGAADDTIILVGKIGRVFGLVGSAISVGMCLSDMTASLKVNDNDAAVAWGLTAAVGTVLLVDGIAYTLTWSSLVASGGLAAGAGATGILSGGLTIVLSLAFFGGIALAIYLTDNPLEKFVKNNILSKENPWDSKTTLPYAYIEELYKNRDILVDTEVSRWRDFITASDDLYDLLISYSIELDRSNLVDLEEKEDPSFGDFIKDIVRTAAGTKLFAAKTITFSVTLRKFYNDKSEFRYVLAFFPKEIKNNEQQDPIILTDTKTILDTSNGLNTLKITFTLNKRILKSIGIGSEFLFFSNTMVNAEFNEYWPSQRGKIRYHCFRLSADYKMHGTGSVAAASVLAEASETVTSAYLGKNIRIGTENELIDPNTWK